MISLSQLYFRRMPVIILSVAHFYKPTTIVSYTSSSILPAEQRYSQIKKECWAICNCFQKFDQWLYGKSDIVIHTDHQPHETIMKKQLNKAPVRLQRVLMGLHRYGLKLTYKIRRTLHLANTLSRAALPQPVVAKVTHFDVFPMEMVSEHDIRNPQQSLINIGSYAYTKPSPCHRGKKHGSIEKI